MNNLYDAIYAIVESVYDKQTQIDDAVRDILDLVCDKVDNIFGDSGHE